MSVLNCPFAGIALPAVLLGAVAFQVTAADRATNVASSAFVATDFTGPLTLRDAAALALAHNPSLLAHGYDLKAADARRLQASRRPNPVLGVEIEDVLGTGDFGGFKSAQTTMQLSQLIELGGKRGARTAVAGALADRQRIEAELARIEILAAVAERFIHVLGDQHEVTLARETTRLAQEGLALAQKRVDAARASPIEEKRARILLARARINEEHAEHESLASRRQLAALWGATNAVFTEVTANLFSRPTIPSFEELAARISRSPELARWTGERSVRDAEIKLADARRRPDLTVGAGVRQLSRSDDTAFVFQFSLPLPFVDRQQGARTEARLLRDKVDIEATGAELRLRTALYGIAQELIHAATELDMIEREMLPDAESALALAREGFERARFSQLELLDAQRTVLELRRERIQAALSCHQFIIEIEKLLGEPLSPQPAGAAAASKP